MKFFKFWCTSLLVMCPSLALSQDSQHRQVDLLIYGATPAGIAAALSAGRSGVEVVLIEPNQRIGGMVTNGLSHLDIRTFEALNGTYLELTQRALKIYRDTYGEDSQQVKDSLWGTHAEPKVNRQVFREMLAEVDSIEVVTGQVIKTVTSSHQAISSLCSEDSSGSQLRWHPQVLIDATYEGDLMEKVSTGDRYGRESRSESGELLAPELADTQVQGYNFRLTMTQVPENRVLVPKPTSYRRSDYLDLLDLFESGAIRSVFCEQSGGIYKYQSIGLPNQKWDINDISNGQVRLSLPDLSDHWPDGSIESRERIFEDHLRHHLGMLHFLQNDASVPEVIRAEARSWGFCRDEFVDNGHLPEQLYVREARRMWGLKTFTQHNTERAEGDARSVLQTDAIAMCDYGLNCHGTAHEGPRIGGRHTGEFYQAVPPYQVPYGVIVPVDVPNLLVPIANSSTHVGYCALRFEPAWTSLGQAAGHAAAIALERDQWMPEVDVAEIQRRLHVEGAATIYVSDVLPGAEGFAAVQWWGTAGGLHGLADPVKEIRGPRRFGQYHEAYPGHAAELGRDLDEPTRRRWIALAQQLGLKIDEDLQAAQTRGQFIRQAYAMSLDRR